MADGLAGFLISTALIVARLAIRLVAASRRLALDRSPPFLEAAEGRLHYGDDGVAENMKIRMQIYTGLPFRMYF